MDPPCEGKVISSSLPRPPSAATGCGGEALPGGKGVVTETQSNMGEGWPPVVPHDRYHVWLCCLEFGIYVSDNAPSE